MFNYPTVVLDADRSRYSYPPVAYPPPAMVGADPYYQYQIPPMAAPTQSSTVYIVESSNGEAGMWLFLIGFCFPLTWFIGSCFPQPITKSDYKWRAINRCMSGFIIVASVICIIAAIIISTTTQPHSQTDPIISAV